MVSCRHASRSCRRRIGRSSTCSTIGEKSVAELSETIGIPLATVKSRIFYARKQLAQILVSSGFEERNRSMLPRAHFVDGLMSCERL